MLETVFGPTLTLSSGKVIAESARVRRCPKSATCCATARASTLIYAKLDIEGLRLIAQPWPVARGAQ
jgi:hypothetical protein